jgi:DNA-binding transcriptional LysR family regulator
VKLQQLRYFVAIIETGSVTAAAQRLNVSQPALSTGMRTLEEELGGELLDRKRCALRPTPLGEKFYGRALKILDECDIAKIEFRRGMTHPKLKIGVLSTIPILFLIDFKDKFTKTMGNVEISFRDGSVSSLLSWLSSGRIDAAVLALDATKGGGWVPLFEEPIVLVCAPAHVMAKCPTIGIQALDGEAFVLRIHCERGRDAHDILSASGVRLRVVLRTDQDNRAFDAVRSQFGITIAPISLVTDLSVVPLEDLGLTRTVGAHISSKLSPVIADAFVDALRDAFWTLRTTRTELRAVG